jgi:hypothetical protein
MLTAEIQRRVDDRWYSSVLDWLGRVGEVTLTEHAHERIRRTIGETTDGRKTGGDLFGFERDGAIVIDEMAAFSAAVRKSG